MKGERVSRSALSDSLRPPRTVAHQAPLSMEFSRQEYWTGLPFPSLGDLPDPGIKPKFPTLQADSLPSEPPGKHILPLKLPSVKFYNFLYIYACVSCSVVSDSL